MTCSSTLPSHQERRLLEQSEQIWKRRNSKALTTYMTNPPSISRQTSLNYHWENGKPLNLAHIKAMLHYRRIKSIMNKILLNEDLYSIHFTKSKLNTHTHTHNTMPTLCYDLLVMFLVPVEESIRMLKLCCQKLRVSWIRLYVRPDSSC